MKSVKAVYFTSFFLMVVAAGHGAAPLFLFSLVGSLDSIFSSFFLPWLHIAAVFILLASFFSKNKRLKSVLENSSLIVGFVFYIVLSNDRIFKDIPLLSQLPFIISFGLFLYFKMMRYFNRNKKMDSNEI